MDAENFLYKLKSILAFQDLSDRLREVEGYLLDIQAYALMALANEGPGCGAIVEIGSFKGRSTCCLALGAMSACREKVYAVDHFQGSPEHQKGETCETRELVETGTTYPAFLENIRKVGVASQVEAIRAPSAEAARQWSGPIRLLFIDGDHSYEASKLDFESWAPFVVPGGIVVFHDIGHFVGVTDFFRELVSTAPNYKQVVDICGMVVVEKVAPD